MMLTRTAARVYALALRAFPRRHRAEYAAEMVDAFARELESRARHRRFWTAATFAVAAWINAVSEGLGERRRCRKSDPAPGRGFALGALPRDLLHAVRSLARTRAFALVCAASLGLGMATIIAIVMFVRAVLSPPPGVNADGLVELLVIPEGPLRAQAGTWAIETWSYPDFVDLRDADTGMALTGWTIGEGLLGSHDGQSAARVPAMFVSANYFTTVGATLARGPGFDPGTDDTTTPVVVMSYRLWTDRLGADPNVVGRTLTVNRVEHVVVGVAPDRFRSHLSSEESPRIQLWIPLREHPRLDPRSGTNARLDRDAAFVRILGRLRPGTTRERAHLVVSSIVSGLAARYPASNQYKGATVEKYSSMGARQSPEVLKGKVMFFGLAGMVLLIVCLNVSGMMLVRSATRERELAVRLAIGASRGRLVQALLSEAIVLAFLGGALAAGLMFGAPALVAWSLDTWSPVLELLRPDAAIASMSVALCFVTSLVFGLLPAIRFSRPSLVSALKDEVGSGGGRRVGRIQRVTAAIQAGLAVPFLIIGGVKIDQVRTTAMADLGFDEQGLFAAPLTFADAENAGKDLSFLFGAVRQNLERASGVDSVTIADGLPLDFDRRTTRITREGRAQTVPAHTTRVADSYFETMRIPLRRGRGITPEDRAGAALVAVISEPLALQLFPGEDAVGQRISFAVEGGSTEILTVAGVTADVVTSQMGTPRPQMFLPLAQHPTPRVMLIARSSAAEQAMAAAFKRAVVDVGPEFAATLVTGDRLVRRSVSDLTMHSIVAGAGAAIALILAALGVYGVVGVMVATRTREIGVRMALGASRPRVLGSVLGDSIKVAMPGIAVGLAIGVVLVRLTNGFEAWYPLGGVEPVVYTLAVAVAILVAMAAGLPSARRASAVDPIHAMRSE